MQRQSAAVAGAWAFAVLAVAGCSGGGGEYGEPVAAPGPAVEVVNRAFYPRAEQDEYWEVIPAHELGDHFILYLHPRIRTPAEGPWDFTFRDPDGAVFTQQKGLHVDTATGQFTFLCRTATFRAGDWWIEMDLQEGGMTAGPENRRFCFRVTDASG